MVVEMNITNVFAVHVRKELDHVLIIGKQIDYLGDIPAIVPEEVNTSEKAE